MRIIEKLPSAFNDFEEMGGVLQFAVFEDADGDEKSAIEAISAIVSPLDANKLKEFGCKRIDDKTFFGDWYDSDSDTLVEPKKGVITRDYGQFVYAFAHPPYGISSSKTEGCFRTIRDFILPPNLTHEISDWTSPKLEEVSGYFSAGMEWWGVFLFTIYIPELRQLTAIAGSATD